MTDAAVGLIDPNDLDRYEKELLARLLTASKIDFEKELNRYLRSPSESKQLVFRHPDLVETTNNALDRLLHRATNALKNTPLRGAENKERRDSITQQIALYAREQKAIRPYLGLAVAEAGRKSDRARAEQLAIRLLWAEIGADVKFLERCFAQGMSTRQAEQAWRKWDQEDTGRQFAEEGAL